jgi:tRNA-binding EMAP/Myf-like protein
MWGKSRCGKIIGVVSQGMIIMAEDHDGKKELFNPVNISELLRNI